MLTSICVFTLLDKTVLRLLPMEKWQAVCFSQKTPELEKTCGPKDGKYDPVCFSFKSETINIPGSLGENAFSSGPEF